jgi:hypothetical protein
MWSLVEEGLQAAFRRDADVAGELERLEAEVADQKTTPSSAARTLLDRFLRR